MKKILVTITLLFLMTTQALAQASYRELRDNFTGRDDSYVRIGASSGDNMVLGWKCLDDGLGILLKHTYLGGDIDGRVAVSYKFDDEIPSPKQKFRLFKSRVITFFNKDHLFTFTIKSLSSKRVMVRVIDPLDYKTLTTTFQPAGLGEELLKLSCVDSLESIQ